MTKAGALTVLALIGLLLTSPLATRAAEHPNILFLSIDDLNDWIGPLGGFDQVLPAEVRARATPNLDRLAQLGVTFTNAHTASPSCNSSRAALMAGISAATSGLVNNDFGVDFRSYATLADVKSLPQHLKKPDGSSTLYSIKTTGKIWHRTQRPDPIYTEWNARPLFGRGELPDGIDYIRGEENPWTLSWIVWKKLIPIADGQPVTDPGLLEAYSDSLPDQQRALWTANQIRSHRPGDQPSFIATGIFLPHLPWDVPVQFFDRFPLESIQIPYVLPGDLEDTSLRRQNIPQRELDRHSSDPEYPGEVNLAWRLSIQAYLASIAYADEAVGKMLDAAVAKNSDQDPDNDWAVVLWSDHGFHLGEKGYWGKFTVWEESTRSPLMFWVPGLTTGGTSVDTPVDFLDIYPTVVDLAGIESPPQTQGRSLVDLLADPGSRRDGYAFTTHGELEGGGEDRFSVRSLRWRFSRHFDESEELYDHFNDPGEHVNLLHPGNLAKLTALGLTEEMVERARAAHTTALFDWSLRVHNQAIYRGDLPLAALDTLGNRVIERFNGSGPLSELGWRLRQAGGPRGESDFLRSGGRLRAASGGRMISTRNGVTLGSGDDFIASVGVRFSGDTAGLGLVFGYRAGAVGSSESYYSLQLVQQSASAADGRTDLRLVHHRDNSDEVVLRFDRMQRLDNPGGPPINFRYGAYTVLAGYRSRDKTLELIVQDGLGVNQFRTELELDQPLPSGSHFGVSSWSALGTSELDDFVVLAYEPVETAGSLIELEASAIEVDESAGSVTVTVRRTGDEQGAIEVDYSVGEVSAWDGVDYGVARMPTPSGTLAWADGDASDKSFEIPIINDDLVEVNERFVVTLGSPRGPARLAEPSELSVVVVDDDQRPSICSPHESRLCLGERRFQVEAQWRTPEGLVGGCGAVQLTADSGYCWFFDQDNVEIVVKVLDACASPFFHYWVFAAGLTNVETSLTVLDTVAGEVRRYDSARGRAFEPIQDVSAFATCP